MKLVLSRSFFALLFLQALSVSAAPFGHESLAPMLERISSAIVNINVTGKLPSSVTSSLPSEGNTSQANPRFLGPRLFHAIGSGVVINKKKGYIITNAHVVEKADSINVIFNDGRKLKARKIGIDRASDIAVLQIPANHLTAIALGHADQMKVGDFVTAIGNPFGLHQSVTSGMISALHRDDLHIEGFEDFIQTDAPINPGNSGGALVNNKGELIGINTAIFSGPQNSGNIGIGFAIPIDMAVNVANQLIKHGKVERGLMGILIQKVTPSLASAMHFPSVHGALVTQVTHGSPAEKAGIKAKDFIQKVNQTALITSNQLRNITGMMPVNTKVKLTLLRNGKKMNKTLRIASINQFSKVTSEHATLLHGVQLRRIEGLNVTGDTIEGVGVDVVDPNSLAWLSGLRPGDIILEADDTKIEHVNQIKQLSKAKQHQILLKVYRNNGVYFLALEG